MEANIASYLDFTEMCHENLSRQHVTSNEHESQHGPPRLDVVSRVAAQQAWFATGCPDQPRARLESVASFAPLADSEQQNLTYVRVDLRVTFCIVLLNVFKLGSLFEGSNLPV